MAPCAGGRRMWSRIGERYFRRRGSASHSITDDAGAGKSGNGQGLKLLLAATQRFASVRTLVQPMRCSSAVTNTRSNTLAVAAMKRSAGSG